MSFEESPFVSIIIVNYNGKHFLKECLASVYNLAYPQNRFEVILVDNASTDGSIEYVRHDFPQVSVLQLDRNYGFCKPNNEGVKIARGEYVVLLNNDTEVSVAWLAELVKGALSDNSVVCCASKMLYHDRRDIINTAGGRLTMIGTGFYRGYGEKDLGQYQRMENVGFGCAAGVLVKRDFFERIGGFDEDYFAGVEEMDLGWKSWLLGFKVLYVPTAVMYHKESGTFGKKGMADPHKVYLCTRNRLYNLVKNLELRNVLSGLIISLAFDTYRAFTHALNWNFSSVKSILEAYIVFFLNLRRTLKKRQFVQKNRRKSDKQLLQYGLMASFIESLAEERRLSKVLRSDFFAS